VDVGAYAVQTADPRGQVVQASEEAGGVGEGGLDTATQLQQLDGETVAQPRRDFEAVDAVEPMRRLSAVARRGVTFLERRRGVSSRWPCCSARSKRSVA